MVESFPGASGRSNWPAVELFRPLEAEPRRGAPAFPGRYDLAIAPGAVLGLKHRIHDVRWRGLLGWVKTVAHTLVIYRAPSTSSCTFTSANGSQPPKS